MEKQQFDSVLGAKFLLAIAHEKGIVLNVTKVQKMLYIIYSYLLAKDNYQVFTETPKAWPYGPVFPRSTKKVDFGVVYKTSQSEFKEIMDLKDTFEAVVDRYKRFTASQLSDWSHMENSPWDRTTKQPGFKWGDYIPDDYIKDYFSKLEII